MHPVRIDNTFQRIAEPRQLFGDCKLFRLLQQRQVRLHLFNAYPGFFRKFQDVLHPHVRVLEVIDRVFHGLLLCQLQVKIKVTVRLPEDEKEL